MELLTFLIRRILLGVLVLWVISVAVFALFFVAPHDPARLLAGKEATPQTVALISARLGLDKPAIVQYGDFMSRLLHGNLGYSYYNSEPVSSLIASRLQVSVSLALGAAVLWLLIGVSAGVLAATRPRSLGDRLVTSCSLFFYSMPVFLLGVLLLYFLFFRLWTAGVHLFPGSGYVPFTASPVQWARYLFLPWLTIALGAAATYSRLTRSGLLEVFSQGYMRTARAKGLSGTRVLYVHGLRSALTPIVTQAGIDLGIILGGVVIAENIFGLPGLGALAVQSITTQDLPVIIGIVLLSSLFVVVANIVVDVLYTVLDPRVRVH
ncbi:MAG TPA: ABC transporter permease [Streptosporangiaceae bacterium]|jgi:peptide/nickel transport system permease protein